MFLSPSRQMLRYFVIRRPQQFPYSSKFIIHDLMHYKLCSSYSNVKYSKKQQQYLEIKFVPVVQFVIEICDSQTAGESDRRKGILADYTHTSGLF
jgi:hypothetical protein